MRMELSVLYLTNPPSIFGYTGNREQLYKWILDDINEDRVEFWDYVQLRNSFAPMFECASNNILAKGNTRRKRGVWIGTNMDRVICYALSTEHSLLSTAHVHVTSLGVCLLAALLGPLIIEDKFVVQLVLSAVRFGF